MIRLGSPNDGGYVVPRARVRAARHLLSLGLSDNWDFELAFVRANPDALVTGVDYSVTRGFLARRIFRSLWKIPAYALIFHRRKVRNYTQLLRSCALFSRFFSPPNRHLLRRVADRASSPLDITLPELLAGIPEQGPSDLFLKMDIEGSEYEALPEIVRNHHRFGCITGEFHSLDTRTADFNEALSLLAGPFVLVHVHGNNCGPYDPVHDFPASVELTWVHRSTLGAPPSPARGPYPRPGLDRPNDPRRPDHPIRLEDAAPSLAPPAIPDTSR
ncbi:MAG: FkbM family methyltransferase [Verrucomicrobiae bacterium]|nr:FkbM family methyltransferase [Verrucomicrobiae bacterium]